MSALRTVVVNDIHDGSDVAVASPYATVSESGRTISLTRQQDALYTHWKFLAKKWRNPDALIVNGDIIEGIQPWAKRTEAWSLDAKDQADDAVTLLKMFGAKKVFVIRGTPAHVEVKGFQAEDYVAQELGAVKEGRRWATEEKLLNLAPESTLGTDNERLFHITHHMQHTAVTQYRGQPPSKALSQLVLNETNFVERGRKIYGIMRGHVHYFWYSDSGNRIMLVNPAWQLRTPFMFKKSPEVHGHIGGCRFTVHDDGTVDFEKGLLQTAEFRPKIHGVG